MSKEITCPHCANGVDEEDVTCSHCNNTINEDVTCIEIIPIDPLTMLCLQLDIPITIVKKDKECPIVEIRLRADSVETIYIDPDNIHETQGGIH